MNEVLPYRTSPGAQMAQALQSLIPMMTLPFMLSKQMKMNKMPLGEALGFQQAPPTASNTPMGAPAGTVPSWAGVPGNMAGIMNAPMGRIRQAKEAMGPELLRSIFMGINPRMSGAAEQPMFEYDPGSGQLRVKSAGGAPVQLNSRQAGVVQRNQAMNQKGKQFEDLMAWRGAVNKRLGQAGLLTEEKLVLENDKELFDLMSKLEEMDPDAADSIRPLVEPQVQAAIARLQKRGVKPLYRNPQSRTGGPSTAGVPGAAPAPAPQPNPAQAQEIKFNTLKLQNPDMSDEEIMLMMAQEEMSGVRP